MGIFAAHRQREWDRRVIEIERSRYYTPSITPRVRSVLRDGWVIDPLTKWLMENGHLFSDIRSYRGSEHWT